MSVSVSSRTTRSSHYSLGARVSLKALVSKTSNRIIFAESDEDFVDILFSFLTLPMGTIIRLTRNLPIKEKVGCMNNLYDSVDILGEKHLRTTWCKEMLLNPQNVAAAQCQSLKLIVESTDSSHYFCCEKTFRSSECKLLSLYRLAKCSCGDPMNCEMTVKGKESKQTVFYERDGGVFVKGLSRLMIREDLKVIPSSTAASFNLLSELGIMDASDLEERTFNIDVEEVRNLLKCSLVSTTPLTDALLKKNQVTELTKEDLERVEKGSLRKRIKVEPTADENEKISVKLMVSKSRNEVCYAEADENFVSLLFSFLTVPLGFIVNETQGWSKTNCINQLYNSVYGLDAEQYLKSKEKKMMLVHPKLAPGFGYEGQPLGIEEEMRPSLYHLRYTELTSDETLLRNTGSTKPSALTVMDPKSHYVDDKNGNGFVLGPTSFTVTDDLVITPLSSISGLSILGKMKVPFSDIEERTVQVGKEEARLLLGASFLSKSALTTAFLHNKQLFT